MARNKSILGLGAVLATLLVPVLVSAQAPVPPEEPRPPVLKGPWRNAGNVPCTGPWGHIYECPPPSTTVAIRAGRLFDSLTGRMLTKQVILVQGQKIADVGPEGTLKIPAGTRVIDLSQATVLPGFIDTHTHVFNVRSEATNSPRTPPCSWLWRTQQSARGFHHVARHGHHGNGYQDVELKNAINRGSIDGPRMRCRAGDREGPRFQATH